MKIVWIIDHYSSEPKYGGIVRQYDFALELAQRGYKVVVISSSFSHFSHSYISEEGFYVSNIHENAHYVYLKTSSYETNNSFSRFKNIFSFERAIAKYRDQIVDLFGKPDVINGCSVHPLAWVAAQKASTRYKARLVIEVRDLWPEIWIASGEKASFHPMVIFFSVLEKWAFNKADKIIYSMGQGDKYIVDKLGINRDKTYLIGQPMDTDRFDEYSISKNHLIPSEIIEFTQDSFVCTFAGYYKEYEGVHSMLEAANILKQRNLPIKMLFVGSGSEHEKMINYQNENNLENVLVYGRVSKESIPALLKNSQVCLAHLAVRNNPQAYQYGVSKNKVNEYLYSGNPTIYGFHDDTDPVQVTESGFVIDPFNAVEFANKIEYLFSICKESLKIYGENGRDFINKNHKVEVLTDKIEEVFFH